MPPKPILHLIESGGIYGAEQVILTLAIEQQSHGEYRPIIGCIVNHPDEPSALYDRAISNNIAALKLCLPVCRYFLDVATAAKILQKNEIKLIHTHGYKPAVFGFFIAKKMNLPIIASCHNWTLSKNSPFKMRAMIYIEKFLYRYFHKVVAVSSPVANLLRKAKVPDEKIIVIKNGIALPNHAGSKTLTRHSLNLSDTDFVFINVARLCEVKDQSALINAFRHLIDTYPHAKLLLLGDGPDDRKLRKLTHDLLLEDHVLFLGFQPDPAPYYQLADCFCLSSHDEGMPISLLEAASHKLPIVATKVGNIPEFISDESMGILVPPNNQKALTDALIKIIESDGWVIQAVEKSLTQLEQNYSSKAMNINYATIYRGALND